MAKILDSKVKIGKIEIQADPNNPDGSKDIVANWGPTVPVIKINDYVLSVGELLSFDFTVRFNQSPSFNMLIVDNNFTVRAALNNKLVDEGVIFIGYANWYIKFNALITTTISDAGDDKLAINGTMHNPDLFNSYQKGYTGMTVTDILTDVCKRSKMGLFTVNGPKLSQTLNNCLNTGNRPLEFFDFVVKTYTNCMWSIDPFYNYHVVDIESLRKQPYDKYTIGDRGIKLPPTDMILTSNWFNVNDEVTNKDKKLKVKYFTINTNYGANDISNSREYSTFFEGNGTSEVKTPTADTFGLGTTNTNSFTGFKNQYFPFYSNVINKLIAGKSITVYMEDIIFELTPFSVVNFECWLPRNADRKAAIDQENSGKKIVIGYSFGFETKNQENNYPIVRQTIDLI